MLKSRERTIHARQRRTQGTQKLRGVRLHGGHGNTIHPGEQSDEVSGAIVAGDRGDREARSGRHQARKFEACRDGAKLREQFVLEIENFQRLVAIGDLENEARTGGIAQEEILVALTGQRFGGQR